MSVPSTCQAAVYDKISSDQKDVQVKEVSVEPVKEGEVIVKAEYASLNPVDGMVQAGLLQGAGWELPLPFTIGYDIAGTVAAVGEGVSDFAVGDRVFAVNWGTHNHNVTPIAGTFKEYVTLNAKVVSKIPEGLSSDKAAAIALVGTTAYGVTIEQLGVKKGDRVLILGGAGAVGQLAIQFAKAAGAWVATTCSPRTMDFVKRVAKPDHIINYREQKWWEAEEVKGVDAIFASVAEKDVFAHAKQALKADGKYASISDMECGFDPKGHPPLSYASFYCLSNDTRVQDLMAKQIVDGSLELVIDETFPFTNEGVQGIISKQSSGTSMGKNVIKF